MGSIGSITGSIESIGSITGSTESMGSMFKMQGVEEVKCHDTFQNVICRTSMMLNNAVVRGHIHEAKRNVGVTKKEKKKPFKERS